MKRLNIYLVIFVIIAGFTACDDQLDVENPNSQTTFDFGNTESELQEAVIACYNRIRLEGTFARVGYVIDAVRGDEVWNSSQQWYIDADNLNHTSAYFMAEWPWRDNYHVVNRANFVLKKVEDVEMSEDSYNEIKGQALFLRSLAYYNLATIYQDVPLITNYDDYVNISTLYATTASQDSVLNKVEEDLTEAMQILPSRNEGGEWASGRATCGAAAGYMARTLMFRQKYAEAYTVLKDIIAGEYGNYALTADFGDNFKESTENNSESLFEVQFMDFGTGGTDEEWTPVNISPNATQGHAVEANYAPQDKGSWGDCAAAPWLYNLFKKETCTDGFPDPRLYWTLVTYEPEYNVVTDVATAAYPAGDPRTNVAYKSELSAVTGDKDNDWVLNYRSNTSQGGISIAKWTYARLDISEDVIVGLRSGINLRLMRYSDVLLRAAECENELNGPTQTAIDYINEVRQRVALPDLQLADFPTADALFEQIANVERPKEFGCENGRGTDLIRWGFFYDDGRLQQIKEHAYYKLAPKQLYTWEEDGEEKQEEFVVVDLEELTSENASGSSYDSYVVGHEYFPVWQTNLDTNPNLTGNSANNNSDNSVAFFEKGYTVRPVYNLD